MMHPAEENLGGYTTCRPLQPSCRHCRDGSCGSHDTHTDDMISNMGILNPFYRFIGRFSGRRRDRKEKGGICQGGREGSQVKRGRRRMDNQNLNSCTEEEPSVPVELNVGCDNYMVWGRGYTPSSCCTPCGSTTHLPPPPPSSWWSCSSQLLSQLQPWLLSMVLVLSLLSSADACSSRSTPKPRPPSPTMRPNITFQTYACPPAYAAWYCLNGATCFTVKIGISILYNCECADGFMGQRCEFKDLDGTYLSSTERLRMSSVVRSAGANVTLGVLVIIIGTVIAAVVYSRKRSRARMRHVEQMREESTESLGCSDSRHNSIDGSSELMERENWWKEGPISPTRTSPSQLCMTSSDPICYYNPSAISDVEMEQPISHQRLLSSSQSPQIRASPEHLSPELLPNNSSLPSESHPTSTSPPTRWWKRRPGRVGQESPSSVMCSTISFSMSESPPNHSAQITVSPVHPSVEKRITQV